MSVRTAGFPTDGLVAAYLMNGTARDSSGRGHHASTSRVTKTANRFDTPRKALYFNGVDSVLTIPNHRDFSVNTTGYLSISVWVRPEGTTLNPDGELLFADTQGSGYVHWFGKGDASGELGNREWSFRVYSADNAETPNRHNRMSFYHFSFDGGLGPGCYVEDPLVSGEWIHYAAVVSKPDHRIWWYKNGELRERKAEYEEQNYVRDKFGIRYPTRLRLISEDNMRLRVKPIKVIDSSFYYLRFLSEITLTLRDGVPRKTTGITEFLAPKTLKYRWLNWISDMRTGKNGRPPRL